jgi:serine/threonine-protein kinase
VPRTLERIVMRCLEKLPADRFDDADDVAERLEAFLRSRSAPKGASLVVRTLALAGLVEGDPATERRLVEQARSRRRGTARAIGGLAVVAGVFAIGGGLVQWSARGARAAAQAGAKPLELAPASAGALRVVATPWAEVHVDGQRVDVTPMARAVPLAAGPHYVTLTHPNAPSDKRVVTIAAGETTTLDVTMNVGAPAERDGGAMEARVAGDGGE